MKKIAISLAVAFVILTLVVSTGLATIVSPRDAIGQEVKVYLKELAMGSTYLVGEVFRHGTLTAVSSEWYLVESDGAYYVIPIDNIALMEVIK